MTSLTTRQRDLLKLLIGTSAPQGSAALAAKLQLTPRQVNYDLKTIKTWLQRQGVSLHITPGVGVALVCSPQQQEALIKELHADSGLQLVLAVDERRQLLALVLLGQQEPLILRQIEQRSHLSRTTIIKDLDELAPWFGARSLQLLRRPNFGIWIEGGEQYKRQALACLLWGDSTFAEPLTRLTHTEGIAFRLAGDRTLLPIVQDAHDFIRRWDAPKSAAVVAQAEAQLGGRFTDDAVLYLAVIFAIQAQRVQDGFLAEVDEDFCAWLRQHQVWQVAKQSARRLAWLWRAEWSTAEIALLAMHLLAAPRNERWPGDLDMDSAFSGLVDELMQHIEAAYRIPGLSQDRTLRDGIVNNVIPACLRQRFDLWMPPSPQSAALPPAYVTEHAMVRELTALICQHTGVELPADEANNLALLLRAAYVREQPAKLKEVLVVCPSGMATAQLLVARLKAHFPRLGQFRIVSLRELGRNNTADAPLIITTAPLPANLPLRAEVIQVHPLLLPEDIERITDWLA